MTDLERVIEQKQRRLDEISRPEIWERYTKNMESGELRDFTQSYRDSQAIVAALRRTVEYDKAEREGRVIVLPCKVGTTVYVNRECLFPVMTYGKHRMEPCEVIAFSRTRKQILAKITTHKAQSENCRYSKKFPVSAFGKTVFLTRADAEAALGGERNG